jgi:cytochrome c peroxidase
LQDDGTRLEQRDLATLIDNGQATTAFLQAFEIGDEVFATRFNTTAGSGANVGGQERYTRVPRADRAGTTEWKNHTPKRATGPNAMACTGCHNQADANSPNGDDGAGEASDNVHRDPQQAAALGRFIQRNTPALFGLGGLQRLGEEMTTDLQSQTAQARNVTCRCGSTATGTTCNVSVPISSKGINFGTFKITRASTATACTLSITPAVSGAAVPVSADLVVRPFQWKGSTASIRDFARGAFHNELGMTPTEFLGSPSTDPNGVDSDGDGVTKEVTSGEVTAMTIYLAQQPRPTTKQELAAAGVISLSSAENASISAGKALFLGQTNLDSTTQRFQCTSCHTASLTVDNSVFSEPSAVAGFRDPNDTLPNGITYANAFLNRRVTFDIALDNQEPIAVDEASGAVLLSGNFKRSGTTGAVVELFGDLRRHNLGSTDAEQIDEVGTGASVFMTENLWGVGSTAPYMHDGRSASITEAIFEHHGEAQADRDRFQNNATQTQRNQLIAFLKNLVLFKAGD